MTGGTILGHYISEAWIQVDPTKIHVILLLATPCTQTEVRRFLGFARYYRRFIKKFSQIESLESISVDYVEAFNQIIKHNIIVTDRDKVVAVSGPLKKKYLGKNINEFTEINNLIMLFNSFIVKSVNIF